LAKAVDRMRSGQPLLARQPPRWRAFSSIHDVEIFLATRTVFAKQVSAPAQRSVVRSAALFRMAAFVAGHFDAFNGTVVAINVNVMGCCRYPRHVPAFHAIIGRIKRQAVWILRRVPNRISMGR